MKTAILTFGLILSPVHSAASANWFDWGEDYDCDEQGCVSISAEDLNDSVLEIENLTGEEDHYVAHCVQYAYASSSDEELISDQYLEIDVPAWSQTSVSFSYDVVVDSVPADQPITVYFAMCNVGYWHLDNGTSAWVQHEQIHTGVHVPNTQAGGLVNDDDED